MNLFSEVKEIKGSNEDVIKYVFEVTGDSPAVFEAVLYKYPTYEDRTVMCISTQSGCNVGCNFCGTGKFFNRDATPDEIYGQVEYMASKNSINLNEVKNLQIMVMSMGEPLLNMMSVSEAFHKIYEVYPKARLLVSTSAPRTDVGWTLMMKCAMDIPTVGLQFSVHESTDAKRNLLIPLKAKLSLEDIANHGLMFFQLSGRKPFFNYCAHEGNVTPEDVMRLRMLFDPRVWECTISVICESTETMAHAVNHQMAMIEDFSARMISVGYNTRIFNPAGQDDIGGGCGQLWQVQEWALKHPEFMKQSAGDKCRSRVGDML